MKKHKLGWSVGSVVVVAALLLVGSAFAAPHARRLDGAGRAPVATQTSWNTPVEPTPQPIASVATASSLPQTATVLASVSPAPISELPNATTSAPRPPRTGPPLWFGLYVPGAPSSMQPVKASESRIGKHAAVVNFFVADSEPFPASRCANIVAHKSTPLITLEFWSIGPAGLSAITNGSKDAYIRSFARNAKAFHKTIWLRPLHEMNTHHYPWANKGSNTPAKLIAAYRHIHNIFAAEGADNVKFVWSPNIDYDVATYYPGEEYLDYAAIDGYNTGKPWRSFASLFGPTYAAVANVTPKPIFIAETACAASPRKAAWVTDMFDQVATNYPRLAGVVWFDDNKEHDWRVNSSASSVLAVKTGLAEW